MLLNVKKITTFLDGQWLTVLEDAGVNVPLGKRHGPCPICGGKDRFKFDDKESRGTWYCNQCGAGDGLSLYAQSLGISIKDALYSLASNYGLSSIDAHRHHLADIKKATQQRSAAERRKTESGQTAARMLAITMNADARYVPAESVPYLANKGFSGFKVPVLAVNYQKGRHPYRSLLVTLVDADERISTAEIIDDQGNKLCLTGGKKSGCFHIISPIQEPPSSEIKTVAIVEGFATGLSVQILAKDKHIPVYCGMSKFGLMSAAVTARKRYPHARIVIAGDNGAELEADAAAHAVDGDVKLPPKEFSDWDDYRQAKARLGIMK